MPAKLNILLVDDDRAFRDLFRDWFKDHKVIEAVNATEAVQRFHDCGPDVFHVAVLDYTLPVGEQGELKDGLELMRHLLHIRENLPVIIVTGAGDREIAREALKRGAYWYLEKPLDRVEADVLLNSIGRSHVAAQTIEGLRAQTEPDIAWLELSHAMVSAKDLQELLDKVTLLVSKILHSDNCTVVLVSEDGKVKLGVPNWEETTPSFQRHYQNKMLAKDLVARGEYHIVADMARENGLDPDFLKSNFRAFAGVACPQEPGAEAVLYVYFKHPLQPEQVDQLKTRLIPLARLIGMALERLHQEKLNDALVSAGRKLLTAQSEPEVYQIVRETLQSSFDVSTFYLALYEEKTNMICFPFLIDKGKEYPTDPVPNTEKEGGLTGYILRTGKDVESHDLESDSNLPVRPLRLGLQTLSQSYLGVPLKLPGGKVIGVLSIQRYVPRRFLEPTKQSLRTLATEVSLALERLRADEASEHVLDDLTRRPWQEVLRDIAQNVKQATGANIITVHPYDSRKKSFTPERIRLGLAPEEEIEPFGGEENYALQRLLEKEEHFVENVTDDEIFWGKFARHFGIVSSGGMVLRAGQPPFPVGVLVVNYRTLQHFDEHLKEALRTHARRAALTLHNLWMQRREAAVNRRIEAEHQAVDQIHRETDWRMLLRNLMKTIQNAWGEETDVEIVPSLMLADWAQRKLYFPEEVKGWYQIDNPKEEGRDTIAFGEGICGWVAVNRQSLVVPDVSNDERYIKLKQRTEAEICVPIKLGDSLLGVLDVEASQKNFFVEADRIFLERIAEELAIRLGAYGQRENAQKVIEAAMQAARQPDHALEELTKHAFEIAGTRGGSPTFVTVFLATSRGLELASAYPPEYLERIQQKGKSILLLEPPPGEPKGIVVRAFQNRETQSISSVAQDPDYIPIDERTQAELAVPIFAPDGAVLGVINVEYANGNALSKEDQQLVETLANQTSVMAVIQKQARDLAESRQKMNETTALALLGIGGVEYGHGWKNAAATINSILDLISEHVKKHRTRWWSSFAKKLKIGPDLDQILTWTKRASRVVNDLQTTSRMGMPDDDLSDIFVKEWLQHQIDRWCEREEKIAFILKACDDCNAYVRANPQWLGRALDNLIANSVRAVGKCSEPQVVLSCTWLIEDRKIRIEIMDNGPGIPEEVKPYLFHEMLPKSLQSKYGWGVGCLIAQFISRTYGGQAYLLKSISGETVTAIELPVVQGGGSDAI